MQPFGCTYSRNVVPCRGASGGRSGGATMTENRPQLTNAPAGKAAMLIRRPVAEVFRALVDPAITSQFWFTRGSGPLEAGRHVQWDWEMYGVSVEVSVKKIEPNRRILIEWTGYSGPTTVEWRFTDRADGTTFVEVTETG